MSKESSGQHGDLCLREGIFWTPVGNSGYPSGQSGTVMSLLGQGSPEDIPQSQGDIRMGTVMSVLGQGSPEDIPQSQGDIGMGRTVGL